MNKNSELNLQTWLNKAYSLLQQKNIGTPRLDAQVIAAHVLGVDRAWVIAHPEHPIDSFIKKELNNLLLQRVHNVPVAYLVGHKEFYGHEFAVTHDVLIPRPETEDIINVLKKLSPKKGQILCDVGCGSGAIAISAALEFPLLVEGCDVSEKALFLARKNARALKAKVRFFQSDLLANAPVKYDFVVANLPYVDKMWQRSVETNFEPPIALFAEEGGLKLIKQLVKQTPNNLKTRGYLILESDPRQHNDIVAFAAAQNFKLIDKLGFILAFRHNGS